MTSVNSYQNLTQKLSKTYQKSIQYKHGILGQNN